jgi:hypothetical protein
MTAIRTARVAVAALVIGMLALGTAGCGSVAGGPASPGAPGASSTGGSTVPATSELDIVVDDGRGTRTTWRLTCDPPGGDHPDPAAACAALDAGARWLRPVPADLACTQIYGGPETATVTGVWRGTPVDATFSRTDGCQIARWDGLVGLFPAGGL